MYMEVWKNEKSKHSIGGRVLGPGVLLFISLAKIYIHIHQQSKTINRMHLNEIGFKWLQVGNVSVCKCGNVSTCVRVCVLLPPAD